MDKLRALQYFLAAADAGSFNRAARDLDVSVPAIHRLIATLERSLGTSLFDRHASGLTLTADGAAYLESCRPLLERLAEADEQVSGSGARPRGSLVIGAPAFVMQSCLLEALPRFHARYPEIDLDFRIVSRVTDSGADAVDVFVLFGWHDVSDFVQRQIGQSQYHLVASPSYWARHGLPVLPSELARHNCLCFRNPEGTLLDVWDFERGSERVSVPVKGWLASNHRDLLLDAALQGWGVLRATGITTWHHVRTGRLVPGLEDWTMRHGPPAHVLFRANQRRVAKVRAFVDFVSELFAQYTVEREGRGQQPGPAINDMPAWQGKRLRKASSLRGR